MCSIVLEGALVCSGGRLTAVQVIDVVLKYMRNNPEVLDQRADRVVSAAFQKAGPCPKT